MKAGLPTTPSVEEWLVETLPPNSRVGIDPFLIKAKDFQQLSAYLDSHGHKLIAVQNNLVDVVWKDRPELKLKDLEPIEYLFSGNLLFFFLNAFHPFFTLFYFHWIYCIKSNQMVMSIRRLSVKIFSEANSIGFKVTIQVMCSSQKIVQNFIWSNCFETHKRISLKSVCTVHLYTHMKNNTNIKGWRSIIPWTIVNGNANFLMYFYRTWTDPFNKDKTIFLFSEASLILTLIVMKSWLS